MIKTALRPGRKLNRTPGIKGAFEVGFYFEVGKKRIKKTVWSKKIEGPST
jgi:hypothetical protein